MRILGIDPGYAIIGFGVVEYDGYRFHPIDYGAITTEAHTPFAQRLCLIEEDMQEVLRRFRPDCMAVEKLYFTNNKTTGIDVAQARGVLIVTAAKQGLPVYEYGPMQVKMALCGYGRATKQQMMDMPRRMLHLEQIPRPDDAADALAIAVCHGHCSHGTRIPLAGAAQKGAPR